MNRTNLIKNVIHSEVTRILILAFLVLYTYQGFINGWDLGGMDGLFYHNTLHDTLEQIDHGVFPVYIGQGIFKYFGSTSMTLAPYYSLLGAFIHLITLKKLDSLYIQHLIVLVSAFSGAFICYFLLNKINNHFRWLALLLAFFYVSCPGIMGLIYSDDMYFSITTLPFLPLFFYGFIRNHQKNDILSLLIIGCSYALLWLSHAPIAEWCFIMFILFFSLKALINKYKIVQLALILMIMMILNLWFFVGAFEVGSQDSYYSTNYINVASTFIQELRNPLPEVFYPLGFSSKIFYMLQLGYSLWFLFLISTIAVFYKQIDLLSTIFLLFIISFILLLYPLPVIDNLIWSNIPNFLNLVNAWPMTRFYIILAPAVVFFAFLTINKYALLIQHHAKIIFCFFILTMGWNLHEIQYFIHNFPPKSALFIDNKLSMLFVYEKPSGYKISFAGKYDPLLKNRLLDKQKQPIKNFDAEKILNLECLKKTNQLKIVNRNTTVPFNFADNQSIVLTQFNLQSQQKYLLCLTGDFEMESFFLMLNGKTLFPTLLTLSYPSRKETRTVLMPIYTDQPKANELKLSIQPGRAGSLKITSLGLVPYDDSKLPIRIESFIPFKAVVYSPQSGNFLELFKQYLPGYEASVNGKKVHVEPSPNKLVMIPLTAGINHVTLRYLGTNSMRLSFYISLIAWILLISSGVFTWWRKSIERI